MLICVVAEEIAELAVEAIMRANHTGNMGDGKVFVRPIEVVETLLDGSSQQVPAVASVALAM
jgi:nitrogen regulatory protein PII